MAIKFYTDQELFEKLHKNSVPSDEYGFMIPIQTLNELAVDPFVPPEKSEIIMEMLKAVYGQSSKLNIQYI